MLDDACRVEGGVIAACGRFKKCPQSEMMDDVLDLFFEERSGDLWISAFAHFHQKDSTILTPIMQASKH